MDMNLLKYRAFVATVEDGSFTRAAERLHYSQSGISRMIADLEREVQLATRDLELARAQLGAFARDPGGMVLGKVFEVVMGLLSRKGD